MNYHTLKELSSRLPAERSIAEVWVENGSRRGTMRLPAGRSVAGEIIPRGWVVAVLDNGIRIKIRNF